MSRIHCECVADLAAGCEQHSCHTVCIGKRRRRSNNAANVVRCERPVDGHAGCNGMARCWS